MSSAAPPQTSPSKLKQSDGQYTLRRDEFRENDNTFAAGEIARWLSGIVGQEVTPDLAKEFASGEIPCRLASAFRDSQIPFKEDAPAGSYSARANVERFRESMLVFGVPDASIFTYADVENNRVHALISSCFAIARTAARKGHTAPPSVVESMEVARNQGLETAGEAERRQIQYESQLILSGARARTGTVADFDQINERARQQEEYTERIVASAAAGRGESADDVEKFNQQRAARLSQAEHLILSSAGHRTGVADEVEVFAERRDRQSSYMEDLITSSAAARGPAEEAKPAPKKRTLAGFAKAHPLVGAGLLVAGIRLGYYLAKGK